MTIEVCVAVILREGRVLVRERQAGSHLEGTWEFPGGKRRDGETPAACA
ncbi:MAG: NUDIX domain-containing protein, partial [Planctomycetota bacterium]